jgi:phospholipid transport system substrate-binding protein
MILGMVLMSVSLFAVAAEPAAGSPGAVVAKLNAALVEVMKDAKALGYQGRYDVLAPVMLATHDFESISKLAVSKYWKTLDEGQRSTLVKKLIEFSIANYAAQFDSYNGEEFVFQSEQPAKNERVTVLYVLKAKDEPEHKFAYTLQQVDGEWRIVNTVVDGFSNLASMKAQYENVLESEGFDSLIKKLSEKIANYAKSREGKNS